MRSTTAYQPRSDLSGPPADLRVTNWPLRDRKLTAASVAIVIVTLGTGIALLAGSPVMGVLASLAIAASMWRMWVRVEFAFGPGGIVQTVYGNPRRIAWSVVKRREVRRHGVLLLFNHNRSPAATLHGLYIRWGDQRAELINIVDYYLGPRAGA